MSFLRRCLAQAPPWRAARISPKRFAVPDLDQAPANIAGEVASLLLLMVPRIIILAHRVLGVTWQRAEAGDSSEDSAARLRHRG
jgi:hypothetical protein